MAEQQRHIALAMQLLAGEDLDVTSADEAPGGRRSSFGSTTNEHFLFKEIFADGYRGPRRGGRRGVLQYDLRAGGAGTMSFFAKHIKPPRRVALSAKPRSER